MDDLISRKAAIEALDVGAEVLRRVLDEADVVGVERAKYEWGLGLIESCIADVKDLPSAQPPMIDEWCDDCKEYDSEKHCCPRWNRVIRQTAEDMKAAQPHWIPVKERLPERCNYYIVTDFDKVDEAYYNSDGRWFSWDGNKLKDVTAWMPLPEPYREGEQDE